MPDVPSIDESIANIHRAVQMDCDENTDLRARLDASNKKLARDVELVGPIAPEAAAYLAKYLDIAQPNPTTPLAPDVAAPPPAVEPPVFTTVDTATADVTNTTGGHAPDIDDAHDVVAPPAPPADPPAPTPEAAAEVAAAIAPQADAGGAGATS